MFSLKAVKKLNEWINELITFSKAILALCRSYQQALVLLHPCVALEVMSLHPYDVDRVKTNGQAVYCYSEQYK